jgi:hypothetical protein
MFKYPSKRYSFQAARAIGDQVSLLMVPHLPGCTARRFDIVTPLIPLWPIELWLVANGPIVPKILVKTSNTTIKFEMYYGLMFRDRRDFLTTEIYDVISPQYYYLEQGAETIAEAAAQGFTKFDLAGFIARGTPDGLLKSKTQRNFALICLQLAQCALYAERNDEASGLLRDTIRYAAESPKNYARLAIEAQSYLARLESDPDGIRKELASTVDYSWSHFEIASA